MNGAIRLLFVLILISSHLLFAQGNWLRTSTENAIAVEVHKPFFGANDNTAFLTSTQFLSLKLSLNNNVALIGELPFAYVELDSDFFPSESTTGNVYAGVLINPGKEGFSAEVGMRVPISPDDDEENGTAASIGIFSEYVPNLEAFVADATPIRLRLNYLARGKEGIVLRANGGPTVWLANGNRDETEWFLQYGSRVGYQGKNNAFWIGLDGRLWMTSGEQGESHWSEFGLGGNAGMGSTRIFFELRKPLDDSLSSIVDWVAELGLAIELR